MPVARRSSPKGSALAEPLLEATKAKHHNARLTWNELPDWMRDNKFIHTGYRAPTNSFR
ncbi:hypothetical protein GGI16_008692, partial [Coemansia sp. S142-1]